MTPPLGQHANLAMEVPAAMTTSPYKSNIQVIPHQNTPCEAPQTVVAHRLPILLTQDTQALLGHRVKWSPCFLYFLESWIYPGAQYPQIPTCAFDFYSRFYVALAFWLFFSSSLFPCDMCWLLFTLKEKSKALSRRPRYRQVFRLRLWYRDRRKYASSSERGKGIPIWFGFFEFYAPVLLRRGFLFLLLVRDFFSTLLSSVRGWWWKGGWKGRERFGVWWNFLFSFTALAMDAGTNWQSGALGEIMKWVWWLHSGEGIEIIGVHIMIPYATTKNKKSFPWIVASYPSPRLLFFVFTVMSMCKPAILEGCLCAKFNYWLIPKSGRKPCEEKGYWRFTRDSYPWLHANLTQIWGIIWNKYG